MFMSNLGYSGYIPRGYLAAGIGYPYGGYLGYPCMGYGYPGLGYGCGSYGYGYRMPYSPYY